jgi:hypothetical protein
VAPSAEAATATAARTAASAAKALHIDAR